MCLCVLPLLVIIGLEATGRLSRCCSSASLHTELRNSAQQAEGVSDETTKVPKSAQIWKSTMEVSALLLYSQPLHWTPYSQKYLKAILTMKPKSMDLLTSLIENINPTLRLILCLILRQHICCQ